LVEDAIHGLLELLGRHLDRQSNLARRELLLLNIYGHGTLRRNGRGRTKETPRRATRQRGVKVTTSVALSIEHQALGSAPRDSTPGSRGGGCRNPRTKRKTGFDPGPSSLARRRSTTELFPPAAACARPSETTGEPEGRTPEAAGSGKRGSNP